MAPLFDEAFERRALLRLLVLRERGRPRRTLVRLSADRPHQPAAVTPQKMLPVVADNELAASTNTVDLAAPVLVHELSEGGHGATGSCSCLMVTGGYDKAATKTPTPRFEVGARVCFGSGRDR